MRPAARVAASVESKLTGDGGKRLVKDVDAAHCFILGDDERRVNANNVRIGHCEEAALQSLMKESSSDNRIERHLGRAIGNEFNADHQTTSAHVSDETVFFLQLLKRG